MKTNFSHRKVMIIDDNDLFREFLAKITEIHTKAKVIQASDPKEGLALLLKENPDLLILDIEMPYVSGDKFLKSLRNSVKFEKLPVLICSALAQPEVVATMAKLNVMGYITKSSSKEEVLAHIVAALQKIDTIANDEKMKKN